MNVARAREHRSMRLVYIAGRGFDLRANSVLNHFVERLVASACEIESAILLRVGLSGYQLADDLREQTSENASTLAETFAHIGSTEDLEIDRSANGEDDITTTMALRQAIDRILRLVDGCTDVVLDVSSLPRIVYLTILLSLLGRLIPDADAPLSSSGITLHILVGEDPTLDSKIRSEDPGNDLVLIPGYAEALQTEALQDSPLIWLPLLGENRVAQLKKIETSIPAWAEICPVLPHPSRNPRRGDQLLMEYHEVLIETRETPLSNIIYVHEGHPFETYRQLLEAMLRYRRTMAVVGGCRLVVTPLASKLVTIGAALACFEMKLRTEPGHSSVAIPYAEPKRYTADLTSLRQSQAEISALVLTGDAYQQADI